VIHKTSTVTLPWVVDPLKIYVVALLCFFGS
jgi:hypothetical protein